MPTRKKTIQILAAVFLGVVLGNGLGVGLWAYTTWTSPGPLSNEQTVIIPRGAGLRMIANQLHQSGVIYSDWAFVAGTYALGAVKSMKPGEYEFSPGMTSREVMDKITAGKTVMRKWTVVEGAEIADVIDLINAAPDLTGVIARPPREGEILPETYAYGYGDDRQELIDRMRRDMTEISEKLWTARQADLPYRDLRDAIVMASIIEKETAIESERTRVAAVYVNRLRRGMLLQADPTVAYAMQLMDKNMDAGLTYDHLATDHPYNTYRRAGLPPGPICNPGRASIAAALNPSADTDLFFVADGKGGHVFAKTLAEHNRNVANWRKINK